ncbi:MAG: hypothetical protein PUE05_08540 [bacterium]|nr:hypothetical protein [bacterium]
MRVGWDGVWWDGLGWMVVCHDRPSEAHCSGCSYLQAALGFASLACPQYAISDGGFAPRGDSINSINS